MLSREQIAMRVAQEFKDGDKIDVHVDLESLLFFDPETGRRIS